MRKRERRKITFKQKLWRAIMHIPMGILIFEAGVIHPIFTIPLTWLFLRYEENEDAHLKDQAWQDIFGAIIGFVIAMFFHYGVQFLNMWGNEVWAWGNYFTPRPLPQFN